MASAANVQYGHVNEPNSMITSSARHKSFMSMVFPESRSSSAKLGARVPGRIEFSANAYITGASRSMTKTE